MQDMDWDSDMTGQSYDFSGNKERINILAGYNEEIAENIQHNILAVDKAKQKPDFSQIILMLIYFVVGAGSRFMVWKGNPSGSPVGFIVSLITGVVLVVIYKLTKKMTYGKLRDMVAAWYTFAQVGTILTATCYQAYYFGIDAMTDLGTLAIAILTWIITIVGVVFVYSSTKKEDIEVNPFSTLDIKKNYEWHQTREARDRDYRLIRDLFMIPVIYGIMKFFCCFITNVLIQLAGENSILGDSVDKFLNLTTLIDWVLAGAFLLLAIGYTIRFFVKPELEKETTEYMNITADTMS